MEVQVNSGNSFAVDAELAASVEESMRNGLRHYENRLTRVEVHLNDQNGAKSGPREKSCQIEARPRGLDPVAASEAADTIDAAVRGAIQKLQQVLATRFGRLEDRR